MPRWSRAPRSSTPTCACSKGFMGLWGLPGHEPRRTISSGSSTRARSRCSSGSLIVAALLAKRYRQAALAFTVMLGAGVTTQILKPLLAVQREYPAWHFMGPEAYPSGHTTAVMSLALALVIVAPIALAGAGGGRRRAADRGHGVLDPGARRPLPERHRRRLPGRDGLGLPRRRRAARRGAAERRRARDRRARCWPRWALLLVLWRPADALNYAVANTTFVLGALVIAAGALVLSGSVPVPRAAPRRPPRHSPHARG